MHEKSVAELDGDALTRDRTFHPSPADWEDQVLYFLLVDRFSDGSERNFRDNQNRLVRQGATPRFNRKSDTNNAVRTEKAAAQWREAGNTWVGGNLKGLQSKLGYLQRLGVTTVWISPILKQGKWDKYSYHGYGTQNFLEIDPHFGTREDLRELVETAHRLGIYVVLDVILNHATDAFDYAADRSETFDWDGGEYPVKAFRAADGHATLPFGPVDLKAHPQAWPDGAVWPQELQTPESWTRKGQIVRWENFPEYEEGDFFSFKDLHLGDWRDGKFVPSGALLALCDVYKLWLTYADLDGFRVDTVKHMGEGAARYFADAMHQAARDLGKRNFYLLAEIAGGRAKAYTMLEAVGMDAALGVDEIPARLRDVAAGRAAPDTFFDLFCNLPASHKPSADDPTWCRSRVVTFFDDHDQIGRPVKGRLAAEWGGDIERAQKAVMATLGLNLTTLGIPCIYYGTEQSFNGHALGEGGGDRYTREAMFGGGFGSWGSRGRHFFDERSPLYVGIARLLAVRRAHAALRRGRQYLREISTDGVAFAFPAPGAGPYRGLIAWSRLLDIDEIVCVLNTDPDNGQSAFVTVDHERHPSGAKPLRCLYSTDESQIGAVSGPPEALNGSAVCLTVPPGGFAIWG